MKRDPRLATLSRDHHHALVLARRASAVVRRGATDAELAATWEDVVDRFARELAPHFAIEERYLLPALDGGGHRALAARTRAEHASLRDLMRATDEPIAARLASFAVALESHVRFEERVLFPVIEEAVGDDVLEAMARAAVHPS